MEKEVKNLKKLSGKVTSSKMNKTIVVSVDRYIKHPKYQKYLVRSKKYKAHDGENICKEGDMVTVESCRPLSKDKAFRVIMVNGKNI